MTRLIAHFSCIIIITIKTRQQLSFCGSVHLRRSQLSRPRPKERKIRLTLLPFSAAAAAALCRASQQREFLRQSRA